MLSALRRFGVSHALRVSTPRAVSSGLTPRALQWHPSSSASFQIASKSLYHVSAPRFSAAQAQEVSAEESEELTKFSQLADRRLVDGKIIRTITDRMNITTMTDVQRMTIENTLKGGDVLAQAKTGTGKTLAFLLPVLQNILNDSTLNLGRRSSHSASDIRSIIISPTRELAEQIATEAKRIAGGTGLMVQTAVGGTQKRKHLQMMREYGCHLLVGTPGRLLDLLSDPYSGVQAPKLSSFVLDEADRLLDDGFSEDIFQIQSHLPAPEDVSRQTLLFSATMPSGVMSMVKRIMKPDYQFIRTVKEDEVPTHLRVPQKLVTLNGFENALPAVLELAKNYQAQKNERPFKAIVYFNSTKEVNLAYEAFNNLVNEPGNVRSGHPLGRVRRYELHSRLTQQRRSLYADKFRSDQTAILFSSDVTARGMDFPDVTHVIQVGLSRDRESYIHRLGRTGRANKTGEGWTLINQHELRMFNQRLHSLPIERDNSLATASVDMTDEATAAPPAAEETLAQVKEALENVPQDLRVETWKACFGSLVGSMPNSHTLSQSMEHLALHGYQLPKVPMAPKNAGRLRDNSNHRRSPSSWSRERSLSRPSGRQGDRGGRFDHSQRNRGDDRRDFRRDDRGGRSRPGGRRDGRPDKFFYDF
ncbi:DEAD/DEAH box helicase [Aspergillus affinis]|uniref:DEAD/DEAH box helicase n=1 Tax=Aspergillus affinis TaxID=1070780 RepID=UPI0022FEA003|nr:ATP-dependent RNA helicase pitchoune [Aspergillus affinis]KAI9042156.1 ATP-dependent RNA helicase pitchoune [Aspergillus affinis]